MPDSQPVRFIPSRAEGLPHVTEVTLYPDRIELHSAGAWQSVRFRDIARWPAPRWWWRVLFALGIRTRRIAVADRDWCRAPRERFFSFYAVPAIVVYMPEERAAAFAADSERSECVEAALTPRQGET
jgi:hypothetical protein